MFSISRFYHGKINFISGKTKLPSFYSTHFPQIYVFPSLLYGNICDSLTTIILKSSHGNLLKLCQMAVFNIFVLRFDFREEIDLQNLLEAIRLTLNLKNVQDSYL